MGWAIGFSFVYYFFHMFEEGLSNWDMPGEKKYSKSKYGHLDWKISGQHYFSKSLVCYHGLPNFFSSSKLSHLIPMAKQSPESKETKCFSSFLMFIYCTSASGLLEVILLFLLFYERTQDLRKPSVWLEGKAKRGYLPALLLFICYCVPCEILCVMQIFVQDVIF